MINEKNPFLTEYPTPHHTTPFHLIEPEHYEPAIMEGMAEQNKEIEAITNNPETPNFENTIVALEKSGASLNRVTTVLGNQLSAHTSDELQAIAEKMMPLLTEHSNNITLNEALFTRIKSIYNSPQKTALSSEENMLLEQTYRSFIRSGANLPEEDKEEFRKTATELSLNSLKFSQNLLKETNAYELHLEEKQLEGLPESIKTS